MITAKEYIEAKLQEFSITISDAELTVQLLLNGVGENETFSPAIFTPIKKTLVAIIPQLLLVSEVSEGDLTIKWNIDGVKAYYSILCKELGLEDVLNTATKPTITNRSNIW